MKWYSDPKIHNKSELIEFLISPICCEHFQEKTLKFHVDNNYSHELTILWSLTEFNVNTDFRNILFAGKHCYIKCHLIKKLGEKWSYSSYSESTPPPYFSCPQSYLELANFEINPEWRIQVNNFHQTHK